MKVLLLLACLVAISCALPEAPSIPLINRLLKRLNIRNLAEAPAPVMRGKDDKECNDEHWGDVITASHTLCRIYNNNFSYWYLDLYCEAIEKAFRKYEEYLSKELIDDMDSKLNES